jgi:hypothetical protein
LQSFTLFYFGFSGEIADSCAKVAESAETAIACRLRAARFLAQRFN